MKRIALVAITVAALAGGSAHAHHSYGDVFRDQTVSIEGAIDELVYANPHVMLKVKTKDSQLYTAEWGNTRTLAEAGVTSTTLKVGDHIVVTGSPMRDPTARKVTLLKEIHRPSDGWRWARTPPTDKPR